MILTHASKQGRRSYQEDRFFTKFVEFKKDRGHFLAVMDGHGGERVAQFCRDQLASEISKVKNTKEKVGLNEIRAIFESLNKQTFEMESGSTLSLAFISYARNRVYVGVLGDSPVVIKDAKGLINIGPEHNARTNMKEREAAIQRGACYSGGYISEHPSYGGLQLTRSLGDNEYKNILGRVPEVYSLKIGSGSFVAILSDGISDPGHKSPEPLKQVVSMLENGASASQLVDNALKMDTSDNVTAIVWRK